MEIKMGRSVFRRWAVEKKAEKVAKKFKSWRRAGERFQWKWSDPAAPFSTLFSIDSHCSLQRERSGVFLERRDPINFLRATCAKSMHPKQQFIEYRDVADDLGEQSTVSERPLKVELERGVRLSANMIVQPSGY